MRFFILSLAVCLVLAWFPRSSNTQEVFQKCGYHEQSISKSYRMFTCITTWGRKCGRRRTTQKVWKCEEIPSTTTAPPMTTERIVHLDCSMGTFFANYRDATSYYECSGNVPIRMTCPDKANQVGSSNNIWLWDQRTKACILPPSGQPKCNTVNGRQPYTRFCNMYVECRNTMPSIIRCQRHFRYDDNAKDCIFDERCVE